MEWELATFQGKTFYLPKYDIVSTIVDHRGKTIEINNFFMHDPRFHIQAGLTTRRSAIKWWIENRSKLLNDRYDYYMDRAKMMFDYCNSHTLEVGTYDKIKEWYEGTLLDPSLDLVDRNRSNRPRGFRLIETQEQEAAHPKYTLDWSYHFKVALINQEEQGVSDTIWTKFYNYSFKMDPTDFEFFRSVKSEDSVMFGLELELSTSLSHSEIQTIVTDVEPKQKPFFIFKSDGSVTGRYDNKLELVTVPCSPRYLRTQFKVFFTKLEKLCKAKGIEVRHVFDTAQDLNNGLHIHVSREHFIDSVHTRRFTTMWNQYNDSTVNLINSIAQRPNGTYRSHSYCMIPREYDGMILSRRLKAQSGERMAVCNTSGSHTIEIRVFQGIFDLQHIMRCISFTEAMFEFARSIGYSDFDYKFPKAIGKFIRGQRKYANLYGVIDKCA